MHRFVILVGVCNEKASKTLEDIVYSSIEDPESLLVPQILEAVLQSDFVKYGFKSSDDTYAL